MKKVMKPAPSSAERWIDCGHNECRSRSNAASGWPCMFAGQYETSVGPVGSPSPAEIKEYATLRTENLELEQVNVRLENDGAALRAALKKAEEAIERLYFAANWHPDRTVDADALWSAIRDAAGITPGQTASRVGPDRGGAQIGRASC